MDLRQEITNHIRWIDSLASLLDSSELSEERLNAISEHDKCALGKWLNSDESRDFQAMPEFAKLVESHKAFHELAGSMVAAVKLDEETEVLALQARFIEESQKVVGYLQQMQAGTEK